MWTDVQIADDARLKECAAVLQTIDRSYSRFVDTSLMRMMYSEKARVWQFVEPDCQIVMVVGFANRLKEWRLQTMGIAGALPVDKVFNIAAAQIESFLRGIGVGEFYSIVRNNLDNHVMNAFADYSMTSPYFQTTIEHEMHDCVAVRFRLRPSP